MIHLDGNRALAIFHYLTLLESQCRDMRESLAFHQEAAWAAATPAIALASENGHARDPNLDARQALATINGRLNQAANNVLEISAKTHELVASLSERPPEGLDG